MKRKEIVFDRILAIPKPRKQFMTLREMKKKYPTIKKMPVKDKR